MEPMSIWDLADALLDGLGAIEPQRRLDLRSAFIDKIESFTDTIRAESYDDGWHQGYDSGMYSNNGIW